MALDNASIITWLRNDLRMTDESTYADSIFTTWINRAKLYYQAPYQDLLVFLRARLIAHGELMMAATSEVDYVANESEVKANQRFIHLRQMGEVWKQQLEEGELLNLSSMRWAAMRTKPSHVKTYPKDY